MLQFLLMYLLSVLLHVAAAASIIAEPLKDTPPRCMQSSLSAKHKIELAINLHPENPGLLERTLYEVSDPSRPRYGQYLTRDQALELTRPSKFSVRAVLNWLKSAGISTSEFDRTADWIRVGVSLGQAQRLVSAGSDYDNRPGESEVVGMQSYPIPSELKPHVATIYPTRSCSRVHGSVIPDEGSLTVHRYDNLQKRATDADEHLMTPQRIKDLYHVPNHTAQAAPGSLIGVVGFGQQQAQFAELDRFLSAYAPEALGRNFSADLVNGGMLEQGNVPSSEANLNVQLVVALAHPIPVKFYSVGGSGPRMPDLDSPEKDPNPIEPWLQFARHLLSLPDAELPKVVTISYGENEQLIPKSYAQKVCSMFGQLGTRGVSVLTASGNFGVGMSCQSNRGKKAPKFMPEWLGTCPWVTAVGAATKTKPEEAPFENFTATDIFSSGGGFSDYFSRPKYQDEAVSKWLEKDGGRWAEYFNQNGRAVPDVSAQGGLNIPYAHNGSLQEDGGGTSAATPIFASLVALLNNERALSGKPPLGFLNPWLYSRGVKGLNDIIRGRNHGCFGMSYAGLPAPVIPDAGWEATEGWDPVTGLGTPAYDKLKELLP